MILKNTSNAPVIIFDRRGRRIVMGAGETVDVRNDKVPTNLPQCVVRVVEQPAVTGETTETTVICTTEEPVTTTTARKKRTAKKTTTTTEQE